MIAGMIARGSAFYLQRLGLAVPSAIILVMVIFAALPLHVPFYAAVAPAFSLIAIYYWTVRRPSLVPNSVVFAAGLLQDILLGTPLGVFTLALLLTRAIADDGRAAVEGRPFWAFWIGFGLVSVSALMIAWTLVAMFSGASGGVGAVALALVTPFVVFPLFVWPFERLDMLILAPDE
jgi:rod shape-determining protein MreD